MIGSVGQQSASQGLEMVGLMLAKSQQKQEGQMAIQLLESAATVAPAPVAAVPMAVVPRSNECICGVLGTMTCSICNSKVYCSKR